MNRWIRCVPLLSRRYCLLIDRPRFVFSQASASAVLIGTQAAAAKKTPVNQWTVDELSAFFAAQELDVHIAAIKREKVDGRMLLDLIAEDGLDELGINSKIHKLRIRRGLEAASDDRPKAECASPSGSLIR